MIPERMSVTVLGRREHACSLLPKNSASFEIYQEESAILPDYSAGCSALYRPIKFPVGSWKTPKSPVPGIGVEARMVCCSQLFSLFERGSHIIGRNINQYGVRLVVKVGLSNWHYRTARTALRLKHQVVHLWKIKLSPAKKVRIKLSCHSRVRGSNLNMSYNVVSHLSFLSSITSIKILVKTVFYNITIKVMHCQDAILYQKRHILFFFLLIPHVIESTGEASISCLHRSIKWIHLLRPNICRPHILLF